MTRRPRKKTRGKLLKSLYIWHRWIGLTAVSLLIVLAVTGLALNHTEDLQLDAAFVDSPALLDWYGIDAPPATNSFQAGKLVITALGNRIYANTAELDGAAPPLFGAVQLDEFIVIAVDGGLLLLTEDGELVERLASGIAAPVGITGIGLDSAGQAVVRTGNGNYRTDTELTAWHATNEPMISWSHATTATADLERKLQALYRGNGLPLERVILDLHSGRILGDIGVLLMDTAAVLCLLLGFSGIWLWARRRASARTHQRKLRQGQTDSRTQ